MKKPQVQRVGPYMVRRLLGSGAMGQVYEAQDLSLNRKIALKVIAPELASDAALLERFHIEGEALAQLDHPNVVGVYSVGHVEGHHYIAMEYGEGITLEQYSSTEIFGIYEVVEIMKQTLSGLETAHNSSVLHRDIKPGNLLIDKNNHIKIIDFGLAKFSNRTNTKLTQVGMCVGTPNYLAPELASGADPTTVSDLYSLGVVIIEMFTGQSLFTGANELEILSEVRTKPVDLPPRVNDFLPPALREILLKLTRKDPKNRFQSAKEVIQEIEGMSLQEYPSILMKPLPRADTILNISELWAQLEPKDLSAIEEKVAIGLAAITERENQRAGRSGMPNTPEALGDGPIAISANTLKNSLYQIKDCWQSNAISSAEIEIIKVGRTPSRPKQLIPTEEDMIVEVVEISQDASSATTSSKLHEEIQSTQDIELETRTDNSNTRPKLPDARDWRAQLNGSPVQMEHDFDKNIRGKKYTIRNRGQNANWGQNIRSVFDDFFYTLASMSTKVLTLIAVAMLILFALTHPQQVRDFIGSINSQPHVVIENPPAVYEAPPPISKPIQRRLATDPLPDSKE